jgi:proline dehydrogenase
MAGGPIRRALLWASENRTLRERLPRYRFVKRAVRKFMPGETLDDALEAARVLSSHGIPSMFTELGEGVDTAEEAEKVAAGYLGMLDRIAAERLDIEISVKLTHLGLDIDADRAFERVDRLASHAEEKGNAVWIDMEAYAYVGPTLAVYHRLREQHANVGICLQAYLRRTQQDLTEVLDGSGWVRLVKGAYREPGELLVGSKREIAENYFRLSMQALARVGQGGVRLAVATHDVDLIGRIDQAALEAGHQRTDFEVQMLYGIRAADQLRLAAEGFRARTLIAFGAYWYPWYMRRLAERPANVFFVLRNLLGRAPARAA